ncbi:rubredoxin-like domain-containing protein [Methanococcus maripaludis]
MWNKRIFYRGKKATEVCPVCKYSQSYF